MVVNQLTSKPLWCGFAESGIASEAEVVQCSSLPRRWRNPSAQNPLLLVRSLFWVQVRRGTLHIYILDLHTLFRLRLLQFYTIGHVNLLHSVFPSGLRREPVETDHWGCTSRFHHFSMLFKHIEMHAKAGLQLHESRYRGSRSIGQFLLGWYAVSARYDVMVEALPALQFFFQEISHLTLASVASAQFACPLQRWK